MSSEMACPKCGSHDVECQAKPHVHRCYACGFDGTSDSINDLAILGSILNLTITERDAERALADEALAVLIKLQSDHEKYPNQTVDMYAWEADYEPIVVPLLARWREARGR